MMEKKLLLLITFLLQAILNTKIMQELFIWVGIFILAYLFIWGFHPPQEKKINNKFTEREIRRALDTGWNYLDSFDYHSSLGDSLRKVHQDTKAAGEYSVADKFMEKSHEVSKRYDLDSLFNYYKDSISHEKEEVN